MKEHHRTTEETRDLYRLYVVFKHTFEAIQLCREADLKKYDITPEQATALILLKNIGEKATPTEVSGWLFRKPHTALNLLRRMQKQGLVDMTPDALFRR
jgi:DNA-binding MarR family transcriptional regulator